MQRLAARVALITGAASGIGAATAGRLAAAGATVPVTDVSDAGVHGEPQPIEDVSLASWERSIASCRPGCSSA